MSENDIIELRRKLHYGLALAERRMLEEKASRDEDVIQGAPDGAIFKVPAKKLLHDLYSDSGKTTCRCSK